MLGFNEFFCEVLHGLLLCQVVYILIFIYEKVYISTLYCKLIFIIHVVFYINIQHFNAF